MRHDRRMFRDRRLNHVLWSMWRNILGGAACSFSAAEILKPEAAWLLRCIYELFIWVQCTIRPPQLPGWWRHQLKLVVIEGRTLNLVMASLPRHEIQLVKVDGIYVSKDIDFGLPTRRTTVNKSVKYPLKQNLFKINSEIIISRMFVQWIVVPNFELQIACAE